MTNALTKPLRSWGLTVGAVGLLACAGLLVLGAEAFFRGYLVAWLFWAGVSLGSLALLMLHHLVAGGWGAVGQRHFEAASLTIFVMALLYVPLLFGMHALYEWTHAEVVASDAVLQHKKPYLNVPFFMIRMVIYFGFWGACAWFFRRWSVRLGETGDADLAQRMRQLAAGGLVGHVLLITFASLDWIMSLEPHWFSSVFGWMIAVSEVLTALAVAILALSWLRRSGNSASGGSSDGAGDIGRLFSTKYLHDYGNLLLAFVVLWMYMVFVQFIIMWAGNVPEDIEWYVARREAPWGWISPVLVIFHFALPFFTLLLRRAKRSRTALPVLAGGLLGMHLLYLAWLVWPAFEHVGLLTVAVAVAAFIGLGGLWCAGYAFFLARRPLVPRRDPRFEKFYDTLEAGRAAETAGS
jgi:hypothetical protein